MIKVENYPNAYREVYVILNNINEENFKAIPQLLGNRRTKK